MGFFLLMPEVSISQRRLFSLSSALCGVMHVRRKPLFPFGVLLFGVLSRWQEILAANPDAKVVVTLRDADAWWKSLSSTISNKNPSKNGWGTFSRSSCTCVCLPLSSLPHLLFLSSVPPPFGEADCHDTVLCV